MSVNPVNPAQQFVPNDRLRLEVETTPTNPSGLVNLCQNPSGDLGTWGYTNAQNTKVDIAGVSGTLGIRLTQTGTANAGWLEPYRVPVTPTQWVSARVDLLSVSASRNVKYRWNWLDSTGAFVSSTADAGGFATAGTIFVNSAQVPSGIAYAQLVLWLYNGTNGIASVNDNFVVRNVMITKNTTNSFISVRTNLIKNPSFETNTTGWMAQGAGQGVANTIARVTSPAGQSGTACLSVTTGTNNGASWVSHALGTTNYAAVTAGKDYIGSAYVRSAVTARPCFIGWWWYDSSGNVISSTTSGTGTTTTSGWTRVSTSAITAPSGAAYARFYVGFTATAANEVHYVDAVMLEQASTLGTYFDGSSTATGHTYAWTGTAHASTSTDTVNSGYDYVDPRAFQNILGGSHEISITRAPLDASTMTATVVDPALDPADTANDVLAVGRMIRCMALVDYETDYPGNGQVWEPIYTGFIDDVLTSYIPVNKQTGEVKRSIEVHATDVAQNLANIKSAYGYETPTKLTKALAATNLPYLADSIAWPTSATANAVARNDDASALDQVSITRDTVSGLAYVDRKGRLQVWSPGKSPWDYNGSLVAPTVTNGTLSGGSNGRTGTVTATAAGNVTLTQTFPVEMAQAYAFGLHCTTTGTNRNYSFTVQWFALDGATQIGATTTSVTVAEPNSTSFNGLLAPQGAYSAKVVATIQSAAASEAHTYSFTSVYNSLVDAPFRRTQYDSRSNDGDALNDIWQDSYSDIDISFATHSCINSVSVNWLRYNSTTGETTEIPYGPYVDQGSIDKNGPYSATYTIQGATESSSTIAAYAANVLTLNANPARTPNSITVPVATDREMRHAVLNEIQMPVVVRYYDTTAASLLVDKEVRIASINHSITTDKWLVSYTFDPVSAVAAPQVTPSPSNQLVVQNGTSSIQTSTSTASVANTTFTTVSGWTGANPFGTVSAGVLTMAVSGTFIVTASATFASNVTGRRIVFIYKNGNELVRQDNQPAGVWTGNVAHVVPLAVGDTLEIKVWQNSTAALALGSAPGHTWNLIKISD